MGNENALFCLYIASLGCYLTFLLDSKWVNDSQFVLILVVLFIQCIYLTALKSCLLLFILVSCFSLQKWNTQLILPACNADTNNPTKSKEVNHTDILSHNESFPVEQLHTFSQLLQNIHRLEVSVMKASGWACVILEVTKGVYINNLFIGE